MSDPRIVASAKNQKKSGAALQDSSRSWSVLGWIGLTFLVVGGMDFALVWFPPDLGNPEWEFGTVTQSFNGLPILLLGLGLLAVAALQTGRRWWGILGTAGSAGLLVWVLVGVVLWGRNVSLALETVPPEVSLGLKGAVAKTLLQSFAYPVLLLYMLKVGWSGARGSAAGSSPA